MDDAAEELSGQWHNPREILSLLLLIGGDVVQRAIAQLVGVYVQPIKGLPRLYLTPVAFSFGWVGYAFTSLASVIGDKQLMPSGPDSHCIVINCDSGYVRVNRSWLLDRVLRDHELAVEAHPGPEAAKLNDRQLKRAAGLDEDNPLRISLRIDIFNLQEQTTPSIDLVWVLGWITIAAQLGISIAPWARYGDWSIFLITASGTLFALLTGNLRQWSLEKWPGRRLNEAGSLTATANTAASNPGNGVAAHHAPDIEMGHAAGPSFGAGIPSRSSLSDPPPADRAAAAQGPPPLIKPKSKIVCLTRGNGHRHAMILVGTGTVWDLETLANATSDSLPETPWLLSALAVAWVCLLISVTGLGKHTWFLMLIGGLGMLQNVYAASAPRSMSSLGLAMAPVPSRPTIIGASVPEWPKDIQKEPAGPEEVILQEDDRLLTHALGPLETIGVRGAIRELEKRFPRAGFALMPEFFPALFRVDPERYRHRKEKEFWEWMFARPAGRDRSELIFEDTVSKGIASDLLAL